MTQQRPVSTKALNAFFVNRGMNLTVALSQIGADLAHLNEETINDDLVARIGRRYGLSLDQLRDGAALHG